MPGEREAEQLFSRLVCQVEILLEVEGMDLVGLIGWDVGCCSFCLIFRSIARSGGFSSVGNKLGKRAVFWRDPRAVISGWWQVRSWRQPTPNCAITECQTWFCTAKEGRTAIYFDCNPSWSWGARRQPKVPVEPTTSLEQRRRRRLRLCQVK